MSTKTASQIIEAIEAINSFWFGDPAAAHYGQNRAAWFEKNAAFDAEIKQRFGPVIDAAGAGLSV